MCFSFAQAQNFKEKFRYYGYVKDLRIVSFARDSTGKMFSLQQNLIHNRMNFRYDFDAHWNIGLELRNRLFYGEFLKYFPSSNSYGSLLEEDPGIVDMQWSWIDNNNIVAHTAIDRMWLNYASDRWDIRIGRQRINWGQNLVWNPNDLFNVLNYADFDYEERPGSDAVRVQHYFKKGPQFEVSYQLNEDWASTVAAAMYRFNTKGYDFQLLAGKYRQDLAIGIGWAGSLKNAGFKGEATYFEPTIDTVERQILTSISFDYTLDKGTFLLASILYNSAGKSDPNGLAQLNGANGGQPSLKSLMPNKYSAFLQASHQLHPLLNASMAAIYAIDSESFFVMPTIGYSLRQDLDLSLVGQGVFVKTDTFRSLGTAIFLRLKWSHST